jgi:hypothetical protein
LVRTPRHQRRYGDRGSTSLRTPTTPLRHSANRSRPRPRSLGCSGESTTDPLILSADQCPRLARSHRPALLLLTLGNQPFRFNPLGLQSLSPKRTTNLALTAPMAVRLIRSLV